MTLFLLPAFIIGIAMLIMGIGLALTGRCLRGSCGGPQVLDADGQALTCAACPNREQPDQMQARISAAVDS